MNKVHAETTGPHTREQHFFDVTMFRFFPYWPLFVVLIALCLAGSWVYMQIAPPVYESSASIMIKDEKKGTDDSKMMDALNIYSSKKIVENEINVFQSRALMNEVVKNMDLYAPVYEQGVLKEMIAKGKLSLLFGKESLHSTSAYLTSPVTVEAKNPESIEEQKKIYFTYDTLQKKVIINGSAYALNEWVNTPFGNLRFIRNTKQAGEPQRPLFFSLKNPKQVAADVLANLNVSAVNKLSTIVTLTLKDPVPERGVDILNQVIQAYNRTAIEDKNTLAGNTLAFVEKRLKIVGDELDNEERKIQQYKSKEGIVNLSDQGDGYLKNVRDNDQQIANANMKIAVLDEVEKFVNSRDNKSGLAPSTVGIDDPGLSKMLEDLFNKKIEYEKLSKTTAENNPTLTALVSQIESIRPLILDNVRSQRKGIIASRDNLAQTNEKYAGVLQSLPQKERGLLSISRQQSIENNIYAFLLQKREETALNYASTVSDSRVVDPAESSVKPVGPRMYIVYVAGLLAALVAGISIVSAKELLSRKILFRSEIEHYTSIPVVAEISHTKLKKPLVVNSTKKQSVAEQFRQLRAVMGMYGNKPGKKKVLVTSSIEREGKSFVASNLALSLALSGKKVVLVDLDLRNPKTSLTFNVHDEPGMAEYILENAEPENILKHTGYNNLFVIGAGGEVNNPTELLLNSRIPELFRFLEDAFDFIIVDTSPVDAVPDAYVLSEYCDTTLFVIRHGYSRKTMIQMLDENDKIKALKNLHIVFNGVKSRGFILGLYGYSYGYGYDYIYKQRAIKARKQAELV